MPESVILSMGKSGPSRWALLRKWWFWLGLGFAVVFIAPLFTPAAYFFWGIKSFAAFLEDNIGFSPALAEFASIPFMFIYIMTFPVAARWLLWPKRDPLNMLQAFLAVLFLFGSKPLLLSTFQTEFSPDGKAQKCYLMKGDDIQLFSRRRDGSCPADTKTGSQTKPLTRQVMEQQQRKLRPPKRIAIDDPVGLMRKARASNPIQFFDPVTGDPEIWYDVNDAGRFELYDGAGNSVISSRPLRPVSQEVVNQILRQIELDYKRVLEARRKDLASSQLNLSNPPVSSTQTASQLQTAPNPATTTTAYKPPRTGPQLIERPAFVSEPFGQPDAPIPAQPLTGQRIPIETPYKGD